MVLGVQGYSSTVSPRNPSAETFLCKPKTLKSGTNSKNNTQNKRKTPPNKKTAKDKTNGACQERVRSVSEACQGIGRVRGVSEACQKRVGGPISDPASFRPQRLDSHGPALGVVGRCLPPCHLAFRPSGQILYLAAIRFPATSCHG